MESDWKKRMGGDSEYNAKRAIAKDAYNAGCIIYSTGSGKWYTPEEFMNTESEKVSIHRGKDDGRKFTIMTIKAGVQKKLEALKYAEADLQNFMGRMLAYSEIVPTRNKK
ncbi:hypothetical protein DBR40_24790 [Pedobacter sp. KBW01]|uniref:hypothetical protein n=1 Tax=Pedobacter sp. KBW01 TaxID=2153364 RepID=UPI000F5B871A|nr:hypothetical protein [Pedobacter sp. KBW01]RQO65092.1 hypothetical protein DBR40_24790 [Pedobacter sp. KBW01]